MTNEERAELRRLAEEATPGEWRAAGCNEAHTADRNRSCYRVRSVATGERVDDSDSSLSFIAAANPATVLSLLDALEANEATSSSYDDGRRNMMQDILRRIRKSYQAEQYIPIEALLLYWPKETRT